MKIHYIISIIIYIILISTILTMQKHYTKRTFAIAQGAYYIGCIHGMNEIYQVVNSTSSTTVSEECIKMTTSEDYKKLVKMIDVMSKGNPK